MLARRKFIIGATAIVALAGPGASGAQDLANLVVDVIDQEFRLGSNAIAGAEHTFHFNEAELVTGSLNSAIVQQLTSAPLVSSASGSVALEWDPVTNSFATTASSFGPVFAERAETMGAGKLNFGFSMMRLNYDSIDGIPLDGSGLGFDIKHQDTGAQDGTTLDNFVEGDLIRMDIALDVSTRAATLFGNFGVLDRLDISVALPIITVDVQADVRAQVRRLSTVSFSDPGGQAVHEFAGHGSTTTLSRGGRATGIGDLLVRGKYNLIAREGRGLAAAAEVSLPSGDDRNLLGTGATGVKMLFIGSATFGPLSPHVNTGYSWFTGGRTELPDQVSLAVGFDMPIHDAVTLAVDVFGHTLLDSRKLAVSQEDHYFRLCDGCTTATPEDQMPIGVISRDVLSTRADDIDLFFASAGLKIRLPTSKDLILTTNFLYSLGRDGLQDEDVIALFGLDFGF